MKHVFIPLPDTDFDVTEVAVPWKAEVRASLSAPGDFVRGPMHLVSRGTDTDDGPAFVVEDGNCVSARWPGDPYRFAKAFIAKL